MHECMGEGNCWNGMANIGERCYYPMGFGPESPGGSAGSIFSFFSQAVLIALGLLFVY